MVIACGCEGPLGQPRGEDVSCLRCGRSYPTKEALQILKLLRLADRETDNDGKPANEHVRHAAMRKAAIKMATLRLKALDEKDLLLPTPPSPQVYARPVYRNPEYATTTVGFGANTHVVGNIFIRVAVY